MEVGLGRATVTHSHRDRGTVCECVWREGERGIGRERGIAGRSPEGGTSDGETREWRAKVRKRKLKKQKKKKKKKKKKTKNKEEDT